MSDEHWYVIMTVPQKEFRAARELRDRGYTVYAPPRKIMVQSKGRKRMMTRSLYPGYIFVHRQVPWNEMNARHPSFLKDRVDDKKLLRGALTVRNHKGEQEPYGIPEEIVGKIAVQCFEIERDIGKPPPQLKVGDFAVVSSGAYRGRVVKVVSMGKKEADVAITIFNAVRLVKAPLKTLEAA